MIGKQQHGFPMHDLRTGGQYLIQIIESVVKVRNLIIGQIEQLPTHFIIDNLSQERGKVREQSSVLLDERHLHFEYTAGIIRRRIHAHVMDLKWFDQDQGMGTYFKNTVIDDEFSATLMDIQYL